MVEFTIEIDCQFNYQLRLIELVSSSSRVCVSVLCTHSYIVGHFVEMLLLISSLKFYLGGHFVVIVYKTMYIIPMLACYSDTFIYHKNGCHVVSCPTQYFTWVLYLKLKTCLFSTK